MSVGVDPGYFTNFYLQTDLGEKGVALLVGLDGIARARQAGQVTTFGQHMSNSNLLKEQSKNRAGNLLTRGTFEGVPRYMSYRTLTDYPLLVAVGTAQEEVLAAFLKGKRQDYLNALIFSAVIVLFAALLMRALKRQRQSVALLADSEKKLDNILSTLHEVVWSMDPHNGRIVYVNAAAGIRSLSACMAFRVPSPPMQMTPSMPSRCRRSVIWVMAVVSS